MSWFDGGLSESNKFISMLVRQAAKTVEGVRYLESMLDRVDAQTIEALRALADDASELRRVLIDELHRTFITPLDREDIFNLSHCCEDMVIYALTTLEEMSILKVGADDYIRRMVELVREQAQELEAAMLRLAKNARVAGDHAREVRQKEREVERLYRTAIKDLFARATEPALLPALFYRREVYRHISNMSDRADSAANVLGMVVMKLA
ncbi:MAG: DUF47 family protein [Betaproteobacteria bacterium]|nr:MAG: DUF47 family protein [Betaproteobacteria bacterium]